MADEQAALSKYCLDYLVPYSEIETTEKQQKTCSYHLKLT